MLYRAPRTAALLASLALLPGAVACARHAAAPAHPAPKPAAPAVNTGDPIPETPRRDPACADAEPGATRWVDSDPRTPFFFTDSKGIHEAGRHCCAPWARVDTEWRELGSYGEVVGRSRLTGGEGYDVTQCYELSFDLVDGKAGVGVRASAEGGWQPPEQPARWDPTAAQRAAYATFFADVERLHVDDPPAWMKDVDQPKPPPLAERTLFFQVSGAPYGKDDELTHYAVSGGSVLLVARLNGKGRWIVSHVLNDNSMMGVAMAYTPLAVVDVNGDGVPEIIAHVNAADSWWDVILRLDANGVNWQQAAESVGGSTA